MATLYRSLVNQYSTISNLGLTTRNQTNFTGNGTFTVPTGFKGILYVTLVAGGGGGGDFYTTAYGGGGGGGAAYFRWPIYVDKSVITSFSVVVGSGGAGSGTGKGADGNPSSFTASGGSIVLSVQGGEGGYGNQSVGYGGSGGDIIAGDGTGGLGGTSATNLGNPGRYFEFKGLPSWQNIRFAAVSGGGSGAGDSNQSGDHGGPAFNSDLIDAMVSTPNNSVRRQVNEPLSSISVTYGGDMTTYKLDGRGGSADLQSTCNCGGGGSFGTGGTLSVNLGNRTPGPGGGGAGARSGVAAQSGGNGLCVVEWFSD